MSQDKSINQNISIHKLYKGQAPINELTVWCYYDQLRVGHRCLLVEDKGGNRTLGTASTVLWGPLKQKKILYPQRQQQDPYFNIESALTNVLFTDYSSWDYVASIFMEGQKYQSIYLTMPNIVTFKYNDCMLLKRTFLILSCFFGLLAKPSPHPDSNLALNWIQCLFSLSEDYHFPQIHSKRTNRQPRKAKGSIWVVMLTILQTCLYTEGDLILGIGMLR